MPLSAAPLEMASRSVPVTLFVIFWMRIWAARFVMPAEAPVSWNFTGIVLPCLKIELPSLLIGCRKPDQAAATVMVNVFELELPAASCAVQVTVGVPSANVEPEAGVHLAATAPSMASAAEAV